MSPILMKRDLSKAQSSRFPPCIFPALNPISTTSDDGSISRRRYVELVLEKQSDVTDLGNTFPTLLKAAWALTLRCFVSNDIICFFYQDQVTVDNRVDHEACLGVARRINNSMLYIGRVDSEEALSSFLHRFERSQKSPIVTAPVGYDIHVVDEQPSRRFCNTIIRYQQHRHEHKELQVKAASDPAMDLTISVIETSNNKVVASIEFRPSYVREDMAQSVLRTFQHVYSQISRAPNNPRLQDVDVCSDRDRDIIQKLTLIVSPPENYCVHDLIIRQCRLHPNQTAVCSWDGDLTYRELDDLSLRLAHHLVGLGVRPETFVFSCFEKSTLAIVSRLAILRAGGAYISIHASNPPAFLNSVIARTNAQFLLSDSNFAHRFRHLVPTVIEVTQEWLWGLPGGRKSPACETVRADNACTILFTSGSTGKPKGIIQVHQSYSTAIRDYARNLKLDSATRFLQFDDYAFDISNLEFLVPLVIGGCCCVPGPMKTIKDLADNINTLKANISFLTPTVVIKLDPKDVPCLKILCVGGEPLPKDLLTKWAGSTTKLINQYGMGEVAICCAYNDKIHLGSGGNIGRPASGAIWVVDALSPEKLMPIGAAGELVIEGPHLSRRYLDQTASHHTDAVFLESAPQWMAEIHPERTSTRLYRSGDMGRWNHDGTIDYIGRKDAILKLNGCRINALEVEHQARKCLSPKDSIVVDILGLIDGVEDPVLTAFLYLNDHPASSASLPKGEPSLKDATEDLLAAEKVAHIKTSAAQSLPGYMIPTIFLLITWMPQTASKKTDRKKVHVVGQKYHLAEREKRSISPSHVHVVQLLPA